MKKLLAIFLLSLGTAPAWAAEQFVVFGQQPEAVCLTDQRGDIVCDPADWRGVLLAVENLKTDLRKVTGRADLPITVGTLGKSAPIDRLAKKKLIPAHELKGKREKFIITWADGTLVIAGSDKRGTIYGIYELSEQLGVSPWYDWADVPVVPHDHIYIKKGTYTDGEPAVRYRGIFLNDEAPCLSGWVRDNYGGVYNHEFYARVFELVLRLKGNYVWPAMWSSAFYADDPLNLQTADDMGICMGTSHHEPMARAHKEWTRDKRRGPWNYDENQAELDTFWLSGVERMKATDDVVTIGMRGNGDEPMGKEADVALLERIVQSQRKLIEQATGRPARETPQVWALYKEVQEYYEKGMQVPDDVILLLCDDNWGNVRILPELGARPASSPSPSAASSVPSFPAPSPAPSVPCAAAPPRSVPAPAPSSPWSRFHPGGYGLYYHVDYVGGPRNSKFLNVTQVQRMWEQLQLTYAYGVNQLWILNVGDLKPMELPIDFWFRMAWNPDRFRADNLLAYTEDFCRQQLGEACAHEAARLLNLQCKYAHRRTPEQLDAETFRLTTGEWQERLDEYDRLERDAERLLPLVPEANRDTYQELILLPVRLMANLYRLHHAVAMNRHYAQLSDPAANRWADRAEACFSRDRALCDAYNHEVAGGKWNHMMDEIHIGYRSWNNPPKNTMPELQRVEETEPSQPVAHGAAAADTSTASAETPFVPVPAATVAVMEASDYVLKTDAAAATWQVIPDFGVWKDAVALLPYTERTDGASLTYAFRLPAALDRGTLTLVFAPTFPFNGGRGQRVAVALDGQELATLNINEADRFVRNGYRDQNYEWEKTRQNRQRLPLPALSPGDHTLTLSPLDPGVVLERLVVE